MQQMALRAWESQADDCMAGFLVLDAISNTTSASTGRHAACQWVFRYLVVSTLACSTRLVTTGEGGRGSRASGIVALHSLAAVTADSTATHLWTTVKAGLSAALRHMLPTVALPTLRATVHLHLQPKTFVAASSIRGSSLFLSKCVAARRLLIKVFNATALLSCHCSTAHSA